MALLTVGRFSKSPLIRGGYVAMKTFTSCLLLTLLLLAACGPAISTPNLEPDASQPEGRPTPTPDAALQPENAAQDSPQPILGYPPLPTPIPLPEGYPAALPAFIEPINPYPVGESAGQIWIIHPFGRQCEDVNKQKYAGAQDARASLTAAGITTYEVTTIEKMVCEACDCPTSAHYRAAIAAADLSKALALGWTQE
jgi:hypothetical protein